MASFTDCVRCGFVQVMNMDENDKLSGDEVCETVNRHVGDKSNTALHMICLRDGTKTTVDADIAAARLLLRANADVHAENYKGWCARLHSLLYHL